MSADDRAPPPADTEPLPDAPIDDASGAADHAVAAPADAEGKPATRPPREPILNPDLLPGLGLLLGGAALPFAIMASSKRFGFSVVIGLVGFLVAAVGALRASGHFARAPLPNDPELTPKAIGPRLVELVAALTAWVATLRLAVGGVLPAPRLSAAVLVTGTFLWCLVAGVRLAQRLGVFDGDDDAPRSPFRRHGFWLVVLTTLLYLPMLGSYSLSDPWETHYGEVAREMLARDDWVSLWWAQDGWFWSKPILNFWTQGLCFSLFGVRWNAGQMLAAAADGRFPQPEWAARMPVFLLTLLGVYFLYLGLRRCFGRRAALLGGLVLIGMPYWSLISHQSMTDMPYVAPLAAGMGLLLYGLHTDPERIAGGITLRFGARSVRVGLEHLVFGAVALIVLPQIAYLLSRNLGLRLGDPGWGFFPHADRFFAGSGGGNCGLPGNAACRDELPLSRQFYAQPAAQGLLWLVLGGVFLNTNAGERRLQRLAYVAGWAFVAVSAMAKGAPGLVLPVFVVLCTVGATRRWRELTSLELPNLLLLVGLIVVPWYLAMYVRHGAPFLERLITHDMYKRAFVHVHDTNVGDDVSFRYYVWQLGYGLFPWTGLTAAGLFAWFSQRDAERSRETGAGAFLFLWFVAGFCMFSVTLTKFHHYILPVVPPAAALTGLLLHRALGDGSLPLKAKLPYFVSLAVGSFVALWGLALGRGALLAGTNASRAFSAALAVLGVVIVFVAARRFGPQSDAERPALHERLARTEIAALGIASALALVLVTRDLVVTVRGDVDGPARLMHLFTYNYKRPWPQTLEFEGALAAFGILAALATALLASERFRRAAVHLLVVVNLWWAAWTVNLYLVWCAPHWGQRETSLAYFQDRQSPNDPFIAYQMNWKGENFYLGNRVPAFVSSGAKFKEYLDAEKKKGNKRFYFVTEHGRVSSLKSELGNPPSFTELTGPGLNNKFFVARVEY